MFSISTSVDEELGFARLQCIANKSRNWPDITERTKREVRAVHATFNGEAKRPTEFSKCGRDQILLHEGGCGGTKKDSHNLCGLIARLHQSSECCRRTVPVSVARMLKWTFCANRLTDVARVGKPLVILEQQKSGSEFTMLVGSDPQEFEGCDSSR